MAVTYHYMDGTLNKYKQLSSIPDIKHLNHPVDWIFVSRYNTNCCAILNVLESTVNNIVAEGVMICAAKGCNVDNHMRALHIIGQRYKTHINIKQYVYLKELYLKTSQLEITKDMTIDHIHNISNFGIRISTSIDVDDEITTLNFNQWLRISKLNFNTIKDNIKDWIIEVQYLHNFILNYSQQLTNYVKFRNHVRRISNVVLPINITKSTIQSFKTFMQYSNCDMFEKIYCDIEDFEVADFWNSIDKLHNKHVQTFSGIRFNFSKNDTYWMFLGQKFTLSYDNRPIHANSLVFIAFMKLSGQFINFNNSIEREILRQS